MDYDALMREISDELFVKPILMSAERRALLLRLAQQDGQTWREDQDASGWDDHMAEVMYGKDADA
jgi:hypothetical protein